MTGGRKIRIVTLMVGLATALGLLTGCDKDKPPTPPTTTAPSPTTASPAPTVTPPAAPKAERSADGAEAFVRYFWEVYNYSYATDQTKEFEQIISPNCSFCKATTSAIRSLNRDGNRIEGSEIELTATVAPPSNPKLGLIVATVINERPGRTVRNDGSTVAKTSGVRNMKSEIAVDWDGDEWIVRDVANDEDTGKPW
jgi:Family of unknown function (DUF6318)